MVNKENINKVIERLKADDGSHFVMGDFVKWIRPVEGFDPFTRYAQCWEECGTAMCIAGWANLIRMGEEGIDHKAKRGKEWRQDFENWGKAQSWLGIDDYDASESLFRMMFHDWVAFDIDGETIRVGGMSSFDLLPEALRRDAGIRVLEVLRDEGRVDWAGALVAVGGRVVDDEDEDKPFSYYED